MYKVEGTNKGEIKLYALSTCIWCKKTRQLLDDSAVEYNYVYVDELTGEEKSAVKDELKQWNPECSYPTVIINGRCIVGYDEDEITAELNK
ncbi:MAG: glutaredoxin family protein [Spirochaetes bacterium]|nr:glutaredoxin family protein [Spirochaetota bacterium]